MATSFRCSSSERAIARPFFQRDRIPGRRRSLLHETVKVLQGADGETGPALPEATTRENGGCGVVPFPAAAAKGSGGVHLKRAGVALIAPPHIFGAARWRNHRARLARAF